jgi:Xaa-Pro aminopeptidase
MHARLDAGGASSGGPRPIHAPHLFAERRRRVMEAIGPGGALILAASPELIVGADTELRYVIDADLYYLTGYSEPEAVAVLKVGDPSPFTMFVRPKDRARETWTGRRGGVEAAREEFGADAAWPIAELAERVPTLLGEVQSIWARFPSQRPEVDRLVTEMMAAGRRTRPRTGRGPVRIVDAGSVLGPMRLIKDDHEIVAMREAARISVSAFSEAAATIRPGAGEWQVEAAIEAAFRRQGASGPAFPTIAASGDNATILHHVANDRTLVAGELLLLDAGARWRMYCADITRTFPASGRFEGERAEVYDIVLAAHDAAIAAVRPGATIADPHLAAQRILVRGMIDLGLVSGSVGALIAEGTQVSAWYPHKTSHWLGLDVHDAGDYVSVGQPAGLEPGMVLTIEPGLYIPSESDAPYRLRGIGVRIEDDVLVTRDGGEVLTAALPVSRQDVAALVS